MKQEDEQIEKSLESKPLISIITVAFNALADLEPTFKSVSAQNREYFEYVLVDGASNDGSREYFKENAHLINSLLSEPDKGIYDAMNKGIRLAKGEYLWFMNAGDTFYADNTIEQVAKYLLKTNANAAFGDAMLVDKNYRALGLRRGKAEELLSANSLKFGMDVCHQSFVVRKSCAPEYDLNYKIASDIDWMIKTLKKCGPFKKMDLIFCNFLTGGFSSHIYTQSWKDRYKVLRKHYGFFPNLFNHGVIASRYLIRKISSRS